jgi:hypothetical protein
MKTEIFGLQLMFLYLLKKYEMIIEVLVEVLKVIVEIEKMLTDLPEPLER